MPARLSSLRSRACARMSQSSAVYVFIRLSYLLLTSCLSYHAGCASDAYHIPEVPRSVCASPGVCGRRGPRRRDRWHSSQEYVFKACLVHRPTPTGSAALRLRRAGPVCLISQRLRTPPPVLRAGLTSSRVARCVIVEHSRIDLFTVHTRPTPVHVSPAPVHPAHPPQSPPGHCQVHCETADGC